MKGAALGFGIAGLVIAIVSIFVPVVSLYVMWVALFLVIFAALFGDKGLTIATIVITAANLIFFSPLTLAALIGSSQASQRGSSVFFVMTIVLFAAPIAAMILRATGKVALGGPRASTHP